MEVSVACVEHSHAVMFRLVPTALEPRQPKAGRTRVHKHMSEARGGSRLLQSLFGKRTVAQLVTQA